MECSFSLAYTELGNFRPRWRSSAAALQAAAGLRLLQVEVASDDDRVADAVASAGELAETGLGSSDELAPPDSNFDKGVICPLLEKLVLLRVFRVERFGIGRGSRVYRCIN